MGEQAQTGQVIDPVDTRTMYYADKLDSLQSLFGVKDVVLGENYVAVQGRRYPVIRDVIILSDPSDYSPYVKSQLQPQPEMPSTSRIAKDIQSTFGQEWQEFSEVLTEHRAEFAQYFDLVELGPLQESRIGDLGCGNGRWSYFVRAWCRELVLVDFSDAFFVARKNLASSRHCLYFMADLQRLPFRADCFDLIFCLGVLHHLPTPCLDAVRELSRFAPRLLVFLYYAMENRPAYFRWMLKLLTAIRRRLCLVQDARTRRRIAKLGARWLYRPMIDLGRLLDTVGLGKCVPLFEFYHEKSLQRIEQDVYDRFFTRIEQRVSKDEIAELRKFFARVEISEKIPYWHFLCVR